MSKIYVEMTEEEYLEWINFKNGKVAKEEEKNEILERKVENVFNTMTANALKRGMINYGRESISSNTIGELIQHTERELKRIRGLGKKGLEEIKTWLANHNLELAKF
jgi:DNA-directed RNA polymerase alpha subunit